MLTLPELMQRVRELEEENKTLRDIILGAAEAKPLVPVRG